MFIEYNGEEITYRYEKDYKMYKRDKSHINIRTYTFLLGYAMGHNEKTIVETTDCITPQWFIEAYAC